MINIYKELPSFENEKWMIRKIESGDKADLLKVYSDKKAVPFFNSDNCNGDTFYYATEERMQQAMEFWEESYRMGYFVRWSVVEKEEGKAVGTIEAFRREAEDYFTDMALLRLDLRSDYEKEDKIEEILGLLEPSLYELFSCKKIASKAALEAVERRKAMERLGFVESREYLVGHDGTRYDSYFVKEIEHC